MSNGLVRLLAAALTLGSVVTVAPVMAMDGMSCDGYAVTASKEKPKTTAEVPQPATPGS